MQSELTRNIQSYSNLMSMYQDSQMHLADCFNGFVSTSCISIHDNAFIKRKQILLSSTNLTDYLSNNQYAVDLPTTNNQTSSCELSPLTPESSDLYLVNCDGQVSANSDVSSGIKVNIVNDGKDLILNNLHYTYSAGNSTNIFNFNTSSPLSVDSDNRTFSGIFLVDAIFNSIPSHFTQRVIISHNY